VHHLLQIAKHGKLSQQMVQDSIHAFAFDLEVNKRHEKIKGSPLNYFMGILKGGSVYLPPHNYESPQARSLRLYAERQASLKAQQDAIEKSARELAFETWLKEMSESERKAILSPDVAQVSFMGPKMLQWKKYFEIEVWPRQRQQLLQSNSSVVK
jgi:hypothetical protein